MILVRRCGGTLISDKHVLTSAHCTTGKAEHNIEVLIGKHNRYQDDSSVTRAKVKEIKNDPKYSGGKPWNYDFSILTLEEPINISTRAAPICLPADLSKDYISQIATLTGWGDTDHNLAIPGLQEVDVTIISNEDCQQLWSGSRFYDDYIDIDE